jgi:hypothetical protein
MGVCLVCHKRVDNESVRVHIDAIAEDDKIPWASVWMEEYPVFAYDLFDVYRPRDPLQQVSPEDLPGSAVVIINVQVAH